MENKDHDYEYLYFDIRNLGMHDRDYKELFEAVRNYLRNNRDKDFSRHNPTVEALKSIIEEAENNPFSSKAHKLALLSKKILGHEIEEFEIKLKI